MISSLPLSLGNENNKITIYGCVGSLSFMFAMIGFFSVVTFWYLLVLFGPVFCPGPSGSFHVAVCVTATSVGFILW